MRGNHRGGSSPPGAYPASAGRGLQPRARQLTSSAIGGLMADTSASSEPHPDASHAPARTSRLLPLTLLALGVVYGDIGTSPLYAMREVFFGSHPVPPTSENVLGVL